MIKADDRVGLVPIKYEDFETIVQTDEAFFLYLQNFETSLADLVRKFNDSVDNRTMSRKRSNP